MKVSVSGLILISQSLGVWGKDLGVISPISASALEEVGSASRELVLLPKKTTRCVDNASFKFFKHKDGCEHVAKKKKKRCKKVIKGEKVKDMCPQTCDACPKPPKDECVEEMDAKKTMEAFMATVENISKAYYAASPPGGPAKTIKEVMDGDTGNEAGCKAAYDVAIGALNAAYAYDYGKVLFKPTLTAVPYTYRNTLEGALSYFIGTECLHHTGVYEYPEGNADGEIFQEYGFGINNYDGKTGWESAIAEDFTYMTSKDSQVNCDTALAIGRICFIPKGVSADEFGYYNGTLSCVDKTFSFKNSPQKNPPLKALITSHHSSISIVNNPDPIMYCQIPMAGFQPAQLLDFNEDITACDTTGSDNDVFVGEDLNTGGIYEECPSDDHLFPPPGCPNGPDDPKNPLCEPINYTNPFNPAVVPDGWVGGFEQSNPEFPYPLVNLTSLPVTSNMANIDKLTRMQQVKWPEFSWEMVPGKPETRVFNTFATYISRLGYDDEGRVWSIICPQQGIGTSVADMNVEVTVTGVRGWTDEPTRSTGVDMSVVGKVWFTANTRSDGHPLFRFLIDLLGGTTDLPFSKEKSIVIKTYDPGNPNQPLFPLRDGMDPSYNAPYFKTHWNDDAYAQVYLSVQIGALQERPGQSQQISDFNELVMFIFNEGSGNILKDGNILSWNIWFQSPQLVNQTEWRNHAEYWRDSYQDTNQYPGQDGKCVNVTKEDCDTSCGSRYFDGSFADPFEDPTFIASQLEMIIDYIEKHFSLAEIDAQAQTLQDNPAFSESDEQAIRERLQSRGLQ